MSDLALMGYAGHAIHFFKDSEATLAYARYVGSHCSYSPKSLQYYIDAILLELANGF